MELMRALGALAEVPGPEHAGLAQLLGLPRPPERAEHTALFQLELPPYASLYLGEEGMLGGVARDRVAGFWGALGHAPPAEPDHLTVLLALYAAIGEREAEQDPSGAWVLRNARKALFWEHIASWMPPLLARAAELAADPYRAWAELLREALAQEARSLGEPSVAPLHFREAPSWRAPETLDALGDALLTPIKSGVVLTRTDLVWLSDALGVGARMGDRRFTLRGLLGSGGPDALGLLAQEAERQAELYAAWAPELEGVTRFWRARAQGTAAALARAHELALAP